MFVDGACKAGIFYTTLMPDMIEEALIDYLAQHNLEYKKKENKYQIDFKYDETKVNENNLISANPEDKLNAM